MEEKKIEAKKFLRQYQNILVNIRNMEAEVEELESMAMGISTNVEMANIEVKGPGGKRIERRVMERVQSSGSGDKISGLVAEICDMRVEIMDKRSEALRKLKIIEKVISKVEDKDYRQLLHRRYIEGNTWERIAVEMNYSYQWVCKLHSRALQEVENILKKISNS